MVHLGVTASNIGQYLESVLYKRDDHLDGRLTQMVNTQRTYTCIALDLLKHYQIRDDEGKPLWNLTTKELGDRYARAKTSKETHPAFRINGVRNTCPQVPRPVQSTGTNNVNKSWYQLPAPKPLRPFQKPTFLGETEACCSLVSPFEISETRSRRGISEKRASVRDTGTLPRAVSAEIVEPNSCGCLDDRAKANNWAQKYRQIHYGVVGCCSPPNSSRG